MAIRTMTPASRVLQGLGIAVDNLTGATASLKAAAKALRAGDRGLMKQHLSTAESNTFFASYWATDAAAGGKRLPSSSYLTNNDVFRGLEQITDTFSAARVRLRGLDWASSDVSTRAKTVNTEIARLLKRADEVELAQLEGLTAQTKAAGKFASEQAARVGWRPA